MDVRVQRAALRCQGCDSGAGECYLGVSAVVLVGFHYYGC